METTYRPQSCRFGLDERTPIKQNLRPSQIRKPKVASPSWLRRCIKRYCCNISIGIVLFRGLTFLIPSILGIWLLSSGIGEISFYVDKKHDAMGIASTSTAPSKLISQNENNFPYLPSGYNPACHIKTKDVISAIGRASSDDCRIQIAEVACRSVEEKKRFALFFFFVALLSRFLKKVVTFSNTSLTSNVV